MNAAAAPPESAALRPATLPVSLALETLLRLVAAAPLLAVGQLAILYAVASAQLGRAPTPSLNDPKDLSFPGHSELTTLALIAGFLAPLVLIAILPLRARITHGLRTLLLVQAAGYALLWAVIRTNPNHVMTWLMD